MKLIISCLLLFLAYSHYPMTLQAASSSGEDSDGSVGDKFSRLVAINTKIQDKDPSPSGDMEYIKKKISEAGNLYDEIVGEDPHEEHNVEHDASTVYAILKSLAGGINLDLAISNAFGGGGSAGAGAGSGASGGSIVPHPLGRAIPDVAKGHEAEYERFLRAVLVYKPYADSDVGRLEIPILSLADPLFGTFDLTRFGDPGKSVSIHTGYRKGIIPANRDKLEIWICPKFLAARELTTSAAHLAPVMASWSNPVGFFWTWGSWDNLNWYDYLINEDVGINNSKSLYAKWQAATPWRAGKATRTPPDAILGPTCSRVKERGKLRRHFTLLEM